MTATFAATSAGTCHSCGTLAHLRGSFHGAPTCAGCIASVVGARTADVAHLLLDSTRAGGPATGRL